MDSVWVPLIVSLLSGAALAQIVSRIIPSKDRRQDTVDSYYQAVLKERDYWRDEAQKKDAQIDTLERQLSAALADAVSSQRECAFWQAQYKAEIERKSE